MTFRPLNSTASFFLVAENDAARTVICDAANSEFMAQYGEDDALHLDFFSGRNIITLGRSGCNITIRDVHGAGIHRKHCYFQYSFETGAVVLHDHSQSHTTQVYDDDETFMVPMSQALHSVMVTSSFNRKVAIGTKKHYRFSLMWDSEPLELFLMLYPYPHQFDRLGPDRFTYDSSKVCYIMGDELGRGASGTVFKAVHIHSGEAMAVKRFGDLQGKRHVLAIREINHMLKSSGNGKKHKHILPILGYDYDKEDYKWIEIFMPLKDGSVKSLVLSSARCFTGAEIDAQIARTVLFQILKALQYMGHYGIVHRDIKPGNILYEVREKDDTAYYHFLLADFSLSNETAEARADVGTEKFMAPEVSRSNRHTQSVKTDIWSLFATVIWIYNTENFREFHGNNSEVHTFLIQIARYPQFSGIRDMAHEDPRDRVSARDLLRRLERRDSSASTAEMDNPMPAFDQFGLENPSQIEWPYSVPIFREEKYHSNYSLGNNEKSRTNGTSASSELGSELGYAYGQLAYEPSRLDRGYSGYTGRFPGFVEPNATFEGFGGEKEEEE